MKERLLHLIKEAELLRAQAILDGPRNFEQAISEAIEAMYWAYNELTQYE
jgi:hypothetical protein